MKLYISYRVGAGQFLYMRSLKINNVNKTKVYEKDGRDLPAPAAVVFIVSGDTGKDVGNKKDSVSLLT